MDIYLCCFCGEAIQDKVTALLAVTNWQKDEYYQENQQLFCHKECLRKSLDNPDHLYIEE